MGISANVTNQQITATVGETQIDVTVSGGVGPTGPQGVAGTTTWDGITGKPSTFTPSAHTHAASDITDFTTAVVAAAPPTTNASLLTSGTLPDARLSGNIARTSDVSSAVAALVNSSPSALDTLGELAAALGNDANFATTVTNSLASKASATDARLTDSREWSAATVSQADAEAGTSTSRFAFTPLRVFQAIAAWWNASAAKTKLDGIDAGATANATDAQLRDRSTHTGTQAASTITGLATVATSGSYADLSGKPTLFDGSYTSLTNVPSTFTPSSHTHGFLTNAGNLNDGANASATNRLAMTNSSGQLVAASLGVGLTVSGTVPNTVAVTYGTAANTACEGNDARLSDARTPLSHTHSALDLTSGTVDIARLPVGTSSTTVAAGNDARFTDARTPTSHASSHQIGGADALSNVVNSPSQITSNQNDYSLPSADVVRLDSDAARDITGFASSTSGRVVVLVNVSSSDITLKHQSTSSSAANRIIVPWSGDYILSPSYAAVLVYDGTTSRWRVI